MSGTRSTAGRRTVAAAVSVAAVLLIVGCAPAEPPGPDAAGAPTPTPTLAGTALPTPSAAPLRALPIYYVVQTQAGYRLYREFHAVPITVDPGTDAVRELLARPRGFDPDYTSPWPPGTQLAGPVRQRSGLITVDLSGEALAGLPGPELAERAVQQLVYTVQDALASTDPVRILVAGRSVPRLWGQVATGRPVQRADPYATRSLVQIDDPAQGAQLGRTVLVRGEAASFEANVPWQVLKDGAVIRTGFTTAAEGQRFAAFSFSLTLEPGEYVIKVVEDDPSGGAGRPPFEDTKSITVS